MLYDPNLEVSNKKTIINRESVNQGLSSSYAPFTAASDGISTEEQTEEVNPHDHTTIRTTEGSISTETARSSFAKPADTLVIYPSRGNEGLMVKHLAEYHTEKDGILVGSTGHHTQNDKMTVGPLPLADQSYSGLSHDYTSMDVDSSMMASGSEVDGDFFPGFEEPTIDNNNYYDPRDETPYSPNDSESGNDWKRMSKEDAHYPNTKTCKFNSRGGETDVRVNLYRNDGKHLDTISSSCTESAEEVGIQDSHTPISSRPTECTSEKNKNQLLISQDLWKRQVHALQNANYSVSKSHMTSFTGLFHQVISGVSSFSSRLLLRLCYNPDATQNDYYYVSFFSSIIGVFINTCKKTIRAHDVCVSTTMHMISHKSEQTAYNCTDGDPLTKFYCVEVEPFLDGVGSSLSTAAAASWCVTHAFVIDDGAALLSSMFSGFPLPDTDVNATVFNDLSVNNSSLIYIPFDDASDWRFISSLLPVFLLTVCFLSTLKRALEWFLFDIVCYQLLPFLQYSFYRGVTLIASSVLSDEYRNYVACDEIKKEEFPVISAVASASFLNYKATLDGVLSPFSFLDDPDNSQFTAILNNIWNLSFPYRCLHRNITNYPINTRDFYGDDDDHLPLYSLLVSSTILQILLVILIIVFAFQGVVHVRYGKYFKRVDYIKRAAEREQMKNIERKIENKFMNKVEKWYKSQLLQEPYAAGTVDHPD